MDASNLSKNAGLVNFGNTCFMNASIQLIMCATVLGSFLIFSEKIFSESDIMKYIQTWKDYMSPETIILGPKIMYHRYMVLNSNYIGFTQEDSHEFLTFTLDDIYEQIKKSVDVSELNEDQKKLLLEEFNKIYKIKFSQTVYYKNKNETSKTEIYENILTLPIPAEDTSNRLEDCVNLYRNQEEDDFKIEYELIKMPKYLFIGLKRFRVTSVFIEKIDKEIEVPFETNCFDEITNYKLKGFIIHSGGVFGGHYYAYGTRKINDEIKWFCYNDTNVTEVSIEQATSESKKAYLFLYSKK
jgi:ubiquitin carboxyl-terminal hydrolase 2/21